MENQNPIQQQQPQQGYYQQPQPNYAAQPTQPYIPQPASHLGFAIFTTLCCCLPLGIVAIIKSSKVSEYYNLKQYDAAIAASNEAKNWCTYALIGWFVYFFIVLIIYFIAGAAAFSFLPGLG
jgi:hypothetical protein